MSRFLDQTYARLIINRSCHVQQKELKVKSEENLRNIHI
jgi:hypothetical protein